jgi:hypothetical protein
LAVPSVFVPGAPGGLPAPLGLVTELFKPPTFPGPEGTPLTPAAPAPAKPALDDPAVPPVPAAAPADAPPAAPPDAPPPEPPPDPPLCANAVSGISTAATINNLAGERSDIFDFLIRGVAA